MTDVICPFTVRQEGNVGQVILDQDGTIIVWTINDWIAQVIVMLLTENEELLSRRSEQKDTQAEKKICGFDNEYGSRPLQKGMS